MSTPPSFNRFLVLGSLLIACRAEVRPPDTSVGACPARPPETACVPAEQEALPPSAGKRLCVVDVGSKNVKLVVASLLPGATAIVDGERTCKVAMNLRTHAIDPETGAGRALGAPVLEKLDAQLAHYARLCRRDGGELRAAVATEWARRVSNLDEVKARLRPTLGMDLEVLTGEQEGNYAYLSAAHGGTDRIVLEAGSTSVQITFRERGDARSTALSLPLGHETAAERIWSKVTSYGAGRAAYEREIRALMAREPAAAAAFDRLRTRVAAKSTNPELVSLGDSGVILAVDGRLRHTDGRWAEAPEYAALIDERRRALATAPWPKRTLGIPATEAFLARLAMDDRAYAGLLGPCVRPVYGAKVLGHLTLIAFLARELGLGPRVVFASGEMAEGVLAAR